VSTFLDHYAVTKAGNEALLRGDATAALEHFRRVTASGRAGAEAWMGQADACRALKDDGGAIAAVDRALAVDPRNFRALIAKADSYAAAGNARAASSYYAAGLRNAPTAPQRDPRLASELRRAQQMCEHYAHEYESFLHAKLAAAGFDSRRSSSRFAQSVDLMTGRKKLFLQQPSKYYFPELPQIQFYERSAFPWLDEVERHTDDIVAELEAIMTDEAAFQPYVERVVDRPRPEDDRLTNSRDWTALYLWKNGALVADNARRCPRTLEALAQAPLCRIQGRTPSILFSRLRPGARIPPHYGFINARLICHLPLIVPESCGFRVGNDVRAWEKGKTWVFDDTIEHEAWNDSKEMRVILLFEIWRPELSEEERALVSALIEAMSSFDTEQTAWNG